MTQERIVFKRNDLYKQVWKEPMTKLAKKYGLSDKGLSKICQKLDIPVPPRGYWAKIQSGAKLKRPPLPRKKYGQPDFHEIQKRQYQESHMKKIDDDSYIPDKIKSAKKISPHKRLHSPHPLVRKTKIRLEKCRPDKYGAIGAWGKPYLNVRIGPKSIGRALRIMNALIRAFEKYGYTVGSDTGWNNQSNSYVTIFGEEVKFSIYEGSNQSLNPKWDEDDDYLSYREKYTYKMSGKLQFQLSCRFTYGIRNKWSDTAKRKLEDILNEILIGTVRLAHFARVEREEREEENRRWQEELKRRAEEKKRREEEEERRTELEQQAFMWNKSKQLRAFIDEVGQRASTHQRFVEEQTKLDEWLIWAKKHADRIDPLKNRQLPFE